MRYNDEARKRKRKRRQREKKRKEWNAYPGGPLATRA
jgi:hypothetical protein